MFREGEISAFSSSDFNPNALVAIIIFMVGVSSKIEILEFVKYIFFCKT